MKGIVTQGSYCFGVFELLPEQRSLTASGKKLSLSSRAFDILNLLVEQRQRIVAKDEIINLVWRGMAVDDNNLAVQISTLRRVLAEHSNGKQFIATVPGQGYRFVVPVDDAEAGPAEITASGQVAEQTGVSRAARKKYAGAAGIALICAGLVLSIGIWVAGRIGSRPDDPPRLSIAVLPFRNLSDDPQQTYLADAISDDLTTDLSHIPGSVVIARESADAYRNKAVSTATIGHALGVRYLLEGSIRREADLLHINAQLIEAKSGAHLWANAFDVGRDGLGTARSDIVRRLAAVLDYTLVQVESARSLHDQPNNPDAMDFFLRARSIVDRRSDSSGLREAQSMFERAVGLAPDSADALAGLGNLLLLKIRGSEDLDEWTDHTRAETVISKALAISPQNPEAISANGYLAEMDGHCVQADESFRAVLSLQPGNLLARLGIALCARKLGRMQEMIDELQTILRIDPDGSSTGLRESHIGMGYLMLGRPREALDWLSRAGARIPGNQAPDIGLGWRDWRQIYLIAGLQLMGDSTEAVAEYRNYIEIRKHRTVWRLSTFDSRALSQLPGYKAYCEALHAAGMPLYSSRNVALVESSTSSALNRGDFTLPPADVPGVTSITTSELFNRFLNKTLPPILDVGRGAAAIPGAHLVWPSGAWGDPDNLLIEASSKIISSSGSPIIVMSDSSFGYEGYDAARILVSHGLRSVIWYKDGEEAWVAAGHPTEDRRSP